MQKEMATPSSICLENAKDRGSWQAAVPEVAKSQTYLVTKQQQQQVFKD